MNTNKIIYQKELTREEIETPFFTKMVDFFVKFTLGNNHERRGLLKLRKQTAIYRFLYIPECIFKTEQKVFKSSKSVGCKSIQVLK
jgi:hypothetical protein